MQTLRWKHIANRGDAYLVSGLTWSGDQKSFTHDHDFPEFFLLEKGRAIHHVNGKTQSLNEGDLVLMRAPDTHCFEACGRQPFRFVNIAFPQASLNKVRQRYFSGDREFWKLNAELPGVHPLNAAQRLKIGAAINRLTRAPRTAFELDRTLLILLGDLVEIQRDSTAQSLPSWLANACDRIRLPEHFINGVSEFVRLSGRSPEHAARSCRNLTGRSPTEWVNEARMEYAAQRLCVGNDEIIEIAMDCGLANLSHFYALFKQRHGCTPRQFRIQNRAITP